jgi:hypothetical protein
MGAADFHEPDVSAAGAPDPFRELTGQPRIPVFFNMFECHTITFDSISTSRSWMDARRARFSITDQTIIVQPASRIEDRISKIVAG